MHNHIFVFLKPSEIHIYLRVVTPHSMRRSKRIRVSDMKKIVISTGGGDAPGLNAVIYAVVHSCYRRGWEVYGSRSGYKGLLNLDELRYLTLRRC